MSYTSPKCIVHPNRCAPSSRQPTDWRSLRPRAIVYNKCRRDHDIAENDDDIVVVDVVGGRRSRSRHSRRIAQHNAPARETHAHTAAGTVFVQKVPRASDVTCSVTSIVAKSCARCALRVTKRTRNTHSRALVLILCGVRVQCGGGDTTLLCE